MNNPLVSNGTPAWGHVGQQKGCQSDFEVGDPLLLDQPKITLNGYDYHPQELAFFSWFFRNDNLGIPDWYSSNGTFTTDARTLRDTLGPQVTLSKYYGNVGDNLTVTLAGFPINDAINVNYGANMGIIQIMTDNNGDGMGTFKIPPGNGAQQITTQDAATKFPTGYAWFEVVH
jgi:hypothetical protein